LRARANAALLCLFDEFCLQRKVQLLSPDKQTFEVEWDVAMRSTVVKQMLEGGALAWQKLLAPCL